MPAVWARTRAELRSRWRAWAGLALLVGLFGGAVLSAGAGARRTQTAYPRMVRDSRDADVFVGAEHTGLTGFYDEVAHVPGVTATGQVAGVNLVLLDAHGRPDLVDDPTANASVDGRLGYSTFRPKLLAGRMPRPERASEVLANPAIARLHRLKVGTKVRALAFRALPDDLREIDVSAGEPVLLTVVGIGVLPPEVVPVSPRDAAPQLVVTPAFYRAYADPDRLPYDATYVRLRRGTDISAFKDRVDALGAARPEVGQVFVTAQADRRTAAQRAILPQAVALAAFAALAGLTGLLVIGQLLARQRALESGDQRSLRSMGMTPGQLMAVDVLRAAAIAVTGGALAMGVAVALSSRFPIGPARLAEPRPGWAVNLALLAAAWLGTVVVLVGRVAWPAWRDAFSPSRAAAAGAAPAPSRAAAVGARAGLPVSAAAGVRMAFDPGRGAAAVPLRTTVAGTAVAVTALLAAVTFGSSLSHLVATPRLYGQAWDVAYDFGFSIVPTARTTALLRDNPSVAAYAGGVYGDVTIGSRALPAVGIDPVKGSVFPTLLDGRPPSSDEEIVLGTTELARLHRHVGDTVTVGVGGEPRRMRVVGRAVFPKLGRGSFSTTSLGDGAAVTAAVLAQPDPSNPDDVYNFLLIRWSPDPARRAARVSLVADLMELAAGCSGASGYCMPATQRPGVIDGYSRVRTTPLVLGGLLALLALATLAHTLVTSIRRRRRDLAVLKTLGFVRHQVSAAVAWQATALSVIAAVVGVPLGVAIGRWLWETFAGQLGVVSGARTPVVASLALVPAALVAANLIGAVPARLAARTPPAVVLRSE